MEIVGVLADDNKRLKRFSFFEPITASCSAFDHFYSSTTYTTKRTLHIEVN